MIGLWIMDDRWPRSIDLRAVGRCALVALIAMIAVGSMAEAIQAEPTEVRLRIAWGGKQARLWTGQIRLDVGELREVAVLGTEPDASGSVWLDGRVLSVGSLTPHLFDGVDVTIVAEPTAQLSIELRHQEGGPPTIVQVAVGEAAKNAVSRPLDELGNRVLVLRTPGDRIRLDTNREDLIFRPGEAFSCAVSLALDDLEVGTSLDLSATLLDDVSGKTEWSNEERLAVPPAGLPAVDLSIPLSATEGVYTLRLQVKRPPGFNARFVPLPGAKAIAARDVQLVVFDTAKRPTGEAPTWRQVLEIDPVNPGWWQRLPSWTQVRRLPGFPLGPLGSSGLSTKQHPLRTLSVLSATPPPAEPHWQAFPLPVQALRRPHLVEVEFPVGVEQHLGLSILEANSAGKVEPIGRDSGIYVEGSATDPPAELGTHRFMFWPRSNSPLLLAVNRHPQVQAQFGRIRVYEAKGDVGDATPVKLSHAERRIIAAYFARPLFPEAFGAHDHLETTSGQSVDGWNTFFDGSTRLAEYLNYAGYNAAVVSVLADGSSIYPSEFLMPTPRHDTSASADGASDVPKKDVLKLLLQSFERRDLAFIPAIQLAAPFPSLESERRSTDPRLAGLELVDRNGRTWLEVQGSDRGFAPYYNLLHPRVQDEIVNLVDELLKRYGNNTALAGVAIQLDGRGFSQLPGLDWGFDDTTIAAFERSTGIMVPGSGPARFAQRADYLLGREEWKRWRADTISQFYERLADQIRAANSDYQFLLTTESLFTDSRVKSQLRPQVLSKVKLDEQMLELGIDVERLARSPGITLSLAQHEGPPAPLVDRAIDFEINAAVRGELSRLTDKASRATLFYHCPQRLRLHTFDSMSPFGAQNTFASLVEEPTPVGSAARRRFIETLAARDPWIIVDGGELLPMGQEDATRPVLNILAQLPRGGTNEITMNQQPVVVRTFEFRKQVYCCVVNECPWQADATVTLDLPRRTTLEVIGETESLSTAGRSFVIQGIHPLTIRLGPYGLWAGRLSSTDVEIKGIQVAVEPRATEEIQARLRDLLNRSLTSRSSYAVLANGGFEPMPLAPGVGGWEVLTPAGSTAVQIDSSQPFAGQGCLRMTEAVVQSPPFKTPPTGQLGLSVNVRAEGTTRETQLRIVFDARSSDEEYRRYTILGGNGDGAEPIPDQWGYYAFGVEDLPLDSQGLMRVRFELTGPGTVWIDDIQLYDLLFPIDNYRRSEQERFAFIKVQHAAKSAYNSGRMADLVRLLDGYWPRFLAAYTPLVSPVIARPVAPDQPAVADTPKEEDDKSPSVGERIRGWMPGFLR